MRHVIVRTISPLLAAVGWLFGPRAAGVDVSLGLVAGGWCALMLAKPDMFDRPTYIGLTWLPDAVWIVFFGVTAALHAAGLVWPWRRNLRSLACLVSGWAWLFVTTSFVRIELTTGVLVYGVLGVGAVAAAVHVSSLSRLDG